MEKDSFLKQEYCTEIAFTKYTPEEYRAHKENLLKQEIERELLYNSETEVKKRLMRCLEKYFDRIESDIDDIKNNIKKYIETGKAEDNYDDNY
jgi:hypothetical protein